MLYRLKGSKTVRCARHIRLQALWASVPAVSISLDFEEWENGASIPTLARAIDIEIDLKYWEEE